MKLYKTHCYVPSEGWKPVSASQMLPEFLSTGFENQGDSLEQGAFFTVFFLFVEWGILGIYSKNHLSSMIFI